MTERDDWRFPEWDALVGQAMEARVLGQTERFEQVRADVLTRIVLSPDLNPVDRKCVAAAIRDELDDFALDAAGEERPTTVARVIAERGLPSPVSVHNLEPPTCCVPSARRTTGPRRRCAG
ncbi:hypothetical protein Ade02nite_47610 [Paractinoplanes deccanensis]|uniref:Uncharacterized protein n=1 Tax=Paractinoplanes deccanensis TaxID=113561 RepID=A0ABQ3Y847_9ACTN|nr:hypothetical protein [Actinoplanes deccanensis]GID76120.1 hypothetical protein Ade02nite_47610 [Actinoplanes deccanensis]